MTDKTTLQILIDARKLIEREENWCQRALALNVAGTMVDVTSAAASRLCMNGAIIRSAGGYSGVVWFKCVRLIKDQTGEYNTDFNDTHTHPEVLAAFDRAIEAERAKVQP